MMRTRLATIVFAVSTAAIAAALISPVRGTEMSGEWRAYGANNGNLKYAPLDQITKDNVKNLRIAWRQSAMTFAQAAALPQAGQLAVQGLRAAGPLRPGMNILINGAGGGVGTIAVQLAQSQNVHVTGVDRGSKLEMMRSLGFDHVIDYEKEDFTKNGLRYDLILDTKTTRSPFEYVRSLSAGGTYATVGGVGPRLIQTVVFGWWIRLTSRKKIRMIVLKQNKDLPYLSERFEAGQLIPVIDGPYKLTNACEAFRHFGAANHKGKVVLTMT